MFVKNLNTPDEVRTLPKTKVEVSKIGEQTVMKTSFEPGWKWSECVKPTVGTHSCQVHHVGYMVSGKMKVRMDDGNEAVASAGDVVDIPAGHDAWILGNETCVIVDFAGGLTYGKK